MADERQPGKLSFMFAKAHGVLLNVDGEQPVVIHHELPSISVITELRRYLGRSFSLQAVSAEDFQKHLSLNYQRGNNEAVQMA